MNQKEMFYEVDEESIDIFIPIKSQGKFRCKTRLDFRDFGKGLAPNKNAIPENAYMEWQIGYDTIIGKDAKPTKLDNLSFIGANGKKKLPYELSELFYFATKINLISKNDVLSLIKKIENYKEFLNDTFKIETESKDNIIINGEEFYSTTITLPTFNKFCENSKISIEITIQKQQYATGVQPMLYVIIPFTEFINKDSIIGHTSRETPYGILRLNKDNVNILINLFICFGVMSNAHNKDVLSILKLII